MDDGTSEIFTSDELTNVINARFAIDNDQCTSGIASSQSISLVESFENGFLGVYEPDADFVARLLLQNSARVIRNIFFHFFVYYLCFKKNKSIWLFIVYVMFTLSITVHLKRPYHVFLNLLL